MRRRSIFAWLFGGAAAGQASIPDHYEPMTGSAGTADLIPVHMRDFSYLRWRSGPALNNQCPVCGEMAPPYVWKPDPNVIYMGSPKFELKNGVLYPMPDEPYRGPTYNWLACEKCSNVFQQRAEETKP